MSDADHQPSRTRVPMPVAALSDPHMGDAARNPDRSEKIIALILFLGFAAMATAPSTSVKMIATGLGAGILLDAIVVRALLVPAAVVLLGRANWWMPAPLARVLRPAAPPSLSDPERA